MSVKALLEQNNWDNKTATEIVVLANDATVKKVNNACFTVNGLANELGYGIYLQIYNKLKTAGHQPMIDMLNGIGIPFAHENVQAELDLLFINETLDASEVARLKALGTWYVTPWSEAGGDDSTPVTVEAVQAELDKRALLQTAIGRYNAARDGLDNGTITTLAELQAVLAGV